MGLVHRQQRARGKAPVRGVAMEITKNEVNEFQRGIRERTVPEGMSWPMFEDGKAVALGDATEDCRCVTRICFTKKGFYFNSSHRKGLRRYRYGEAVRHPWTPDADGVRTKVGDTVWNLGDGRKGVVTEVKGDGIVVDRNGGSIYGPASRFVHEKPVYTKDGFRIVEGLKVFYPDYYDLRVTVVRIDHDTDAVLCKSSCDTRLLPAKRLVAKLPDSWERLEDDATRQPYAYCVEHGLDDDDSLPTNEKFARDLVRRAKKLAGVSE